FYRRMHMLLQRESPLAVSCSPLRRTVQFGATVVVLALASACFGRARLAAQEKVEQVLPPRQERISDEQIRKELESLRTERNELVRELKQLRDQLDTLRVAPNRLGRRQYNAERVDVVDEEQKPPAEAARERALTAEVRARDEAAAADLRTLR